MQPDDRDQKGRFLTGSKGGPGRSKGSRNKLGEAFLEALCQDFEQHGAPAIVKVRNEEPGTYLKVIASLMPKEMIVKHDALDEMSDDELLDALATVRSIAAELAGAKARARNPKAHRKGKTSEAQRLN